MLFQWKTAESSPRRSGFDFTLSAATKLACGCNWVSDGA